MRFWFCFGAAVAMAHSAEPVLTHLHPAGIQQGTSARVKVAGKFEPWPCKVWTDTPGIVFTPAKDVGTFDVVVSADVKTGPHLLRAFNDQGASAPISMVIDSPLQTMEKEPNDDFRAPQVLGGTAATCNGRLDKPGDVDTFSVALKKGQTMIAWIEAYTLAAGFDAMLRIVDSKGLTLAFNHDHTTMDPFLAFCAPEDGPYMIQTMGQKYPASSEISFAGGDDCVYRLHVSTEAFVRNTWPLAVPRLTKTSVTLEGWNLNATQAQIDSASPPVFPVTFSHVPEFIEIAEPQLLAIPSGLSGRIGTPGEEDRFSFTATKDTKLVFSVKGPTIGSMMDPWLKILNKDGKQLAIDDDAAGRSEPRIVWAAPADATYTVVLGEVTSRGGADFFYHLVIVNASPSVSASILTHGVKLEAGKSAEVKITVAIANGYQSKLKLAAKNLPPGITAQEVDVPEKGGEAAITLAAETNASRASQPWQLVLREAEGGTEHPVIFSMASTTEDNGVPQGYHKLLINTTDQIWLTVTVTPPPAAPAPAAIPSGN